MNLSLPSFFTAPFSRTSRAEAQSFDLEDDLVAEFVRRVKNRAFPLPGCIGFAREFDYSNGRTDVVLLTENGKVISVEAKLHDWRYALHQAYRNTCFSDYSFVLLPNDMAETANQYYIEFERRSVGILVLSGGGIDLIRGSNANEPIHDWLKEKASRTVINDGERIGRTKFRRLGSRNLST